MFPKKCLVVGYTWKNDAIYLQVRDLGAQAPVQDLLLSGEFCFRILNERRCIGWIDFGRSEIMSCPDMAVIKRYQCDACRQREGFMPCVMCNGFNCPPLKPAVEAYCRQTHHLYLASFGDNNIKVGTTSASRKYIRLLDQGPLAAAYVATAPGPTIKQMEYNVSRLGYTEAMRRTQKRALLSSGMSENEARQLVLTALEDITRHISQVYQTYFHVPEFFERPPMAIASREFSVLDEIVPKSGEVISGQVLAANGHTLILGEKVAPVTLDLADLKSWIIEINPLDPKPVRTKQLPLF